MKSNTESPSKQYIWLNVDNAIDNGWIKVYYQPVVRAATGKICGFEALARWFDPKYGFLSPASFIPALEEIGAIDKIDRYIIREVCRNLRENLNNALPVAPVSLNLSRLDFLTGNIVDYIEQVRKEYHIESEMLTIEITESVMLADEEIMKNTAARFQSLGYKVWMDDFGTGYSSLDILKKIHFDEIKLDMLFMKDFDETSKAIVISVISMLKKLGMGTLAEGVERKEQMDFLKNVDCDKVQGYYICRPLPYEEVLALSGNKIGVVEGKEERIYYEKLNSFKGHRLYQQELMEIADYGKAERTSLSHRYGAYLEKSFDSNNTAHLLSIIDLQNTMLKAMSRVCASFHLINLQEDTFLKVFCVEYIDNVLRHFTSAQAALYRCVDLMFNDESSAAARAFLDLSTLPDRLGNKHILHFDYNGNVTGWCRGQFVPVSYDENGRVKEVFYIVQQIQEEKLKEEELKRLAETDGLSRVLNRTGGEKHISELLRLDKRGLFLLFDVDGFKNYNDMYGHVAGDEVIRKIGVCMKSIFAHNEILVRLGGDEFAVYAPDIITQEEALEKEQALIQAIGEIEIDGIDNAISISTGVLQCYGKNYREFDDIYRDADKLMYKMKNKI